MGCADPEDKYMEWTRSWDSTSVLLFDPGETAKLNAVKILYTAGLESITDNMPGRYMCQYGELFNYMNQRKLKG